MPTYRNDAAKTIYPIEDKNGKVVLVAPGESIETFHDLSGISDMTQTAATPTAEAAVTAAETWTDWIKPEGPFNVSVSGTFTATVTLQRSFDGGTTPLVVATFTEAGEKFYEDFDPNASYRIGVDTEDFTSGQADVRVSCKKTGAPKLNYD
jgi:hypothetical protein